MPPSPLDRPVIRPAPRPLVERAAVPAPPLLLTPLRLEYRVIEPNMDLTVASVPSEPERRAGWSRTPLRYGRSRAQDTQVWVRWYPDDPFGVDAPKELSDAEAAALARYRSRVQALVQTRSPAPRWFDVDDPELSAAWQEFVGAVSFARALQLWRADRATLTVDRPKQA